MLKVKIFWGSHAYASMKIFYLEFFINEIFSVEKFPNYGNNSVNLLMRNITHLFSHVILLLKNNLIFISTQFWSYYTHITFQWKLQHCLHKSHQHMASSFGLVASPVRMLLWLPYDHPCLIRLCQANRNPACAYSTMPEGKMYL